jgi:hypothetical protein
MPVSNTRQIKSRGQGIITIPYRVSSANATIPMVDPSRTVLTILGFSTLEDRISYASARLWMPNGTTISAIRYHTSDSGFAMETKVGYQYVEYL